MSFVRIFVVALIALSVSADARAQFASVAGVPYVGLELGFGMSSADVRSRGNDVGTSCDAHYAGAPGIYPTRTDGFDFQTVNSGGCTIIIDTWSNEFERSIGRTYGATVGLSRIAGLPFRVEAEYLYRKIGFNERNETYFPGPKSPEFNPEFGGDIYGELGNVTSHNYFGNIYYDFRSDDDSFIPYLGFGVGWSQTKFDMTHFFHRNDSGDTADPATGQPTIRNLDADGNCEAVAADDCVLEVVEGVVSYARKTHDDATIGFQILLGADYAVSKKVSVGLKLRWAYFGDIEGDREPYDTLRNHASTVAPDSPGIEDRLGRTNSVYYRSTLKGDQIWGAAVSLKYKFF